MTTTTEQAIRKAKMKYRITSAQWYDVRKALDSLIPDKWYSAKAMGKLDERFVGNTRTLWALSAVGILKSKSENSCMKYKR